MVRTRVYKVYGHIIMVIIVQMTFDHGDNVVPSRLYTIHGTIKSFKDQWFSRTKKK